jgi:YidC/Oxa1 family membrane protein insertase
MDPRDSVRTGNSNDDNRGQTDRLQRANHSMGLMQEVADLWRLRYHTPKSARAITIYSEHESYYAYYEGLIDALKRRLDSGICYITSDPNDPILESSDPKIHAVYLNKLLPFFMKFVRCPVFVMTLTDLNQFHLQRSVNPVHYIYVFHAMNSIHMTYRLGAFDYYDSIFCTGPYQVKELTRDTESRSIRKRNLVEVGYSRVERIQSAWKWLEAKGASGRRTILVAPSWAASNALETHGIELVRTLLHADFEVIVRPHPETHKRFPDLIARFETNFADDERFRLERSVRTDDSLLRADVLITDWSGIALEYAFGTERPVLYIDVPRKVHNDRYEELGIEPFEVRMRDQLGIVVTPEELGGIVDIIGRLIRDQASYRDRIVRLRDENVFNFGHSCEIGAEYICRLLANRKLERVNRLG